MIPDYDSEWSEIEQMINELEKQKKEDECDSSDE